VHSLQFTVDQTQVPRLLAITAHLTHYPAGLDYL
jgi:hypothetical protein